MVENKNVHDITLRNQRHLLHELQQTTEARVTPAAESIEKPARKGTGDQDQNEIPEKPKPFNQKLKVRQ